MGYVQLTVVVEGNSFIPPYKVDAVNFTFYATDTLYGLTGGGGGCVRGLLNSTCNCSCKIALSYNFAIDLVQKGVWQYVMISTTIN